MDTPKIELYVILYRNSDNIKNGVKANKGAEVDIVEANSQKDQYSTGIHWDGYKEYHQGQGKNVPAPGVHSGYHTWTLQWNKEHLRFFFDGILNRHITDTDLIPWVEEYLIDAVFEITRPLLYHKFGNMIILLIFTL